MKSACVKQSKRCSADGHQASTKLFSFNMPMILIFAASLIFAFLSGSHIAGADSPPDWNGGTPADVFHFPPAPWPTDPANLANCTDTCGQWKPYTRFQNSIKDPRVQDPSNGGTAPQNYVNVSSSCIDKSLPSIYYYLHQGVASDGSEDVIMFRWRVEQIANNYATGPSAGNYGASDPWSSALWTVLFDVNGDGFRDLAAHLNGSSGDPTQPIDRIAGIWGNIPTQSIDYVNDPSIHKIADNPTAFTSGSTILNFNSNYDGIGGAHQPSTTWPPGGSATSWDYGTTRAKLVSSSPCSEYFVDYQIPVKMLDASSTGPSPTLNGPKITRNTPIAMMFCTANSLNNPFQKDCAISRSYIGNAAKAAPFGDYLSFNTTTPYAQPIVAGVTATPPATCPGSYTLTAKVQDTMYIDAGGTVQPSIKEVTFYYWYDKDGDGTTAGDGTNAWTSIGTATLKSGTLNIWTASWNATSLPKGKYLIGVQAVDDKTLHDDDASNAPVDNRTISYIIGNSNSQIATGGSIVSEVTFPSHSPPMSPTASENWYSNPAVTGSQTALVGVAINDCGVAPELQKSASPSQTAAGQSVTFTISVVNKQSTALTVDSITDTLPTGFSYSSTDGSSSLCGGACPTPTSTGTTPTWTFSTPVSVPGACATGNYSGCTKTLILVATAPATAGTYNNISSAATSFGTITSSPVTVQVDSARISLSNTPSTYSVSPGGAVVYTLNYSNDSAVTVSSSAITDTLPANASCTSYSINGGASQPCSGQTANISLGTLDGGATGSVTLNVAVGSGYSSSYLTNSATLTVTPPGGGSNVTKTADSTIAVSVPTPAFTLTKALTNPANVVQVAPGTTVTWTITYKNYGTGAASGVTITDTLPAGFTYSSSSNSGSNNSGTVTWSIDSVSAGSNGSVTVNATAAASPFTYPNPAVNSAKVTWTGNATGVTATNDVGVTGQYCSAVYYFHHTTPAEANYSDLTIIRPATTTPPAGTSDNPTAVTGISNNSYNTTNQITFQTPPLASALDISNKTLTVDFDLSAATGGMNTHVILEKISGSTTTTLVTSSEFSISNGNAWYPFTATMPAGTTLAVGDILQWRFQFKASGNKDISFHYDTITYNSRSSFCEPTAPASLTLTKTVDKANVTTLPDSLQYTLQFANTGGTNATGVSVTDTLPANVTFVSATLNGTTVTPSQSGQQLTFTGVKSSTDSIAGEVTAGKSGTIVINATVTASASGTLTNNATLSGTGLTSATASAGTTVGSSSDVGGPPTLSITKTADKALLSAGDTVTYTVRVANTGGTAANVVVSDTIPSNGYFTYVSGSITDGDSRSVSGSTLSWTINSLPGSSSKTVTFQMKVASTGVPSGVNLLDNTATISSYTGCASSCGTSNTVTVSISGNPSLTIAKSVSPTGGRAPGDTLAYTLTVSNTGSAGATNVVVYDPIPSYVSYAGSLSASDTGSGDWSQSHYDAIQNRVVFSAASLGSGKTATLSFQVNVNSPLPSGSTTISNTATVSASNAASKQSNTVSSTATAAPVLTLAKTGPAQAAYPAATLTKSASSTKTLYVNDTSQLTTGQYVLVGGTTTKITAVAGGTVTVADNVSATAPSDVIGGITYQITYQNTGNAVAAGTVLTDTLPSSTFVWASDGGSNSSGTVTWNIGSVDPGSGGTVQVVIFPVSSGAITNSAHISSGSVTADSLTITTSVGGLKVTKSTSTPTVKGDGTSTATYVIEVENTLAGAANGINVTDTLASGFTYASTTSILIMPGGATATATASPTSGDSSLTWSISTPIPGGKKLVLTFTAQVAGTTGAATYQNDAGASSTDAKVVPFDPLLTTAEDVTVLAGNTGTVDGYVYQDNDGDGAFNLGDSPLTGTKVTILDQTTSTTYDEYTDSSGYFRRAVRSGQATVTVTNPSGMLLATGNTNPATVTVPTGSTVSHNTGYVSGSVVVPTLTLQAATNVGTSAVTGNGTLTATGGANASERGFCWSTTGNPTTADSNTTESGNFGTGAFTGSITGLSAGSEYYVRAYATSPKGTGYSTQATYTTAPSPPTANAATGVSSTGFTANWSAPSDTAAITGYKLDVATNSSFSSMVSGYNDLSVSGTSQAVTGLSAGTPYYYRVRAVNAGGTSLSSGTITVTTTSLSNIVTNTNDSGAGSLRQVLSDANSGDSIAFASGLAGQTITLTSGQIEINKNITIDASALSSLVSISGGSISRVFLVCSGFNATLRGLKISNCNSVTHVFGGGIFNAGNLTIDKCIIQGNSVLYDGGGIYTYAELTITDSAFIDNTAVGTGANYGAGGGLIVLGGSTNLINCTFSGNSAFAQSPEGGGAIAAYEGTLNLDHVTISGNTVTGTGFGGGIIMLGSTVVNLANCIIANNTKNGNADDLHGQFNSQDYNLIETTTGATFTGTTTHNMTDVDPLLSVLGYYNNGLTGRTPTLALLPDSPALGAIPNGATGCGTTYTSDQRGMSTGSGGSACDMGAFHSRGFTLSISAGNSQSAVIGTAFTPSPQAAVAQANGEPVDGGRIVFTAPGSGARATLASPNATISSGSASVAATANCTLGSYTVSADTKGNLGSALSFSLTNAKDNPSFTVNSSSNPSVYGNAVTFTATVSGSGCATPTGTLTFKDGSSTLDTATLSSGQGSFTTSSLSAGTHSITVAYGGDGNFNSSTSSPISQEISKAEQTINFASLGNKTYGDPPFTVSATGGGSGSPVTFSIVSGPATASGTNGETITLTGAGSVTVRASQAGSSNYLAAADVDRSFTVYTTVSSINLVSTSPSNAASVSWTVTFANAITGLTSANFSLVPGTWVGGAPAITGVTGSGTTWTVTANTGSGDGTLGLNMVNSTSVSPPANGLPAAGPVYTIDKTAPTASISGAPASPTSQTGATLTVGGTDVTNYKYKVDSDSFSATEIAVATGITLSNLPDGSHTVYVIGKDSAGNWQSQASPTTATWTVDKTKPVITGLADDTNPTKSKSWTWSATDASSVTYRYVIDQSATATLTGEYGAATSAAQTNGDGTYYLHVQAKDAAGNESDVTTVSAILDNTAPTASISGAPLSPTKQTGATLTVAGSGVTTYKYKVDGGSFSETEIPIATNITLSNLTEGSHTVSVIGKDSTGNWQSEASATTATWTVDTTRPVITELSDDATPTASKSWTWSATDSSLPVTYRYVIDQNSTGAPTGAYGATTSASQTNGDGTYYLHVQAKDAAGNESDVKTVSAVLDNTAPTASISGAPASPTSQTGAALTVAGTGVTHYKYKVDSSSFSATEIAVVTGITLSNLSDGSHTVYVIGKDSAGNWQSQASPTTATWTVDTTKPVVTGLSDDTTATGSKSWTWSATDSSLPVTYRYVINQSGTGAPTGAYGATTSANQTSGDGAYYLHVQAKDAAGNESDVKTVSAVLDNTAPTASVSGAPASLTSQTGATLTVAGAGVTHYKYKVDSGSFSATEIPIATNITLTGLTEGSHTVYVIGKDSAGNWQSQDSATTATWTVDTTKPVVTGLSDDPTATGSKSWTWSATDSSLPVTYRYVIDQSGTGAPTGEYGATTSVSKASGDGTWYLHVQAKDAAGNESDVKTVSAVLDNTAPTASLTGAPASPTSQTGATLTVGGTGVTNYKYKVDSGSFSITEIAIATNITLSNLTEGSHTVSVIGKDSAGNWQSQESATTATWTVDTVKPVITGLSDDATATKSKSWTWSATDSSLPVIYRYVIDQSGTGAPTGAYGATTSAGQSSGDGAYYLHVQAKDAAGNESDVKTVSAVLDNTAPTASISGAPASPTNQTGATLTVGGTGVTHYKYKVDSTSFSATEIAVATVITLTNLGEDSHTVYVIGRDSLGNWQSQASPTTATWTVDTTKPVITGLTDDATPTKAKSWTWAATDSSLPVTYRYVIDQSGAGAPGGAYGATTSASKATGDGAYYLHVQARDAAGNESDVKTVSALLDNTAPTASISGAPSSPFNKSTASLTVGGAGVTHYKYRLDSGGFGAEIAVSNPITLSDLGEGSHVVEVIGKDSAGNWQSNTAPTSATWTVDTTPPVITGLSNDPNPTKSKSWSWSATDTSNPVSYRYAIDQSSTATLTGAYGSTTSASKTSGDGTWYLHVQAKDAAGNESGILTVSALLDNTAPLTASLSGAPSSPTNRTGAILTVGGKDVTHYKYKLDSAGFGAETAVSIPITLSGLPEGSHTVAVIGRDSVGNWQGTSAPTSATWVVDTTAPVITGLSNDAAPAKAKSWSWSATDTSNPITYRYAIDQSSTAILSGAYGSATSAGKANGNGTWYLHVQAKDAAENESEVVTVSALLDNMAPTAFITYAPSRPYKAGDVVAITATFSEPMANSPAPRIAISGANTLGAAAMAKTDSTHYTYRYTVGAGDGIATVALSIGTDIAGNGIVAIPTSGADFTVDNTAPALAISAPSSTFTASGPVTYTVTYSGESAITLADLNIILNRTGTAAGTVHVSGTTGSTRTVTVSGITGDGALGISLKAGTARDEAGNAAPAAGPSATFAVDKTAPQVISINRGAPLAEIVDTAAVTFTATFSEAVTGISASNFNLAVTGVNGASIASVTAGPGNTWSVGVNTGTGDGTIGLNMVSATGATDAAGNGLTGLPFTGQTYSIDKSKPKALSINRANPSAELTNASSVTYKVIFSEPVFGLSASNFSLPMAEGLTGASITSITAEGGSTWTVAVDTGSGSGVLGLNLVSSKGLTDSIENAVSPLPFVGQTYTVDKTGPTVASITRTIPVASVTNASSVTYTVKLSEHVTGLSASNLKLSASGVSGASIASVTAATDTTWKVVVGTGTGEGTLRLDLVSSTGVADAAGNGLTGLPFSGEVYTIDRTAPTVAISAPSKSLTRSGPVTFTITYTGADKVSLQDSDIALNKTGTATGTVKVSGTGADARTVTISSITGNGTLGISLAAGSATDAAGNTASAAGPGTPFKVDNTGPTVTSIKRATPAGPLTNAQNVTYTVTFTEPVSGVTATNFAAVGNGVRGASIASVAAGAGNSWVVVLSTGSGDGSLALKMINSTGAADAAGNAITGLPFTGEAYTLDRTPPTVAIGAPSQSLTRGGPVSFTIAYTGADTVSLEDSDVTLEKTGTAVGTVKVSGTGAGARIVTISSITGDGTLGISLAAGSAVDAAGNSAVAAGPSAAFKVDNTSPTVTSINRSIPVGPLTNAQSVTYTVTFSEPVTEATSANFALAAVGVSDASISSVKAGAGNTWIVSANTGRGDGALALNMINSTGVGDAAGNPVAGLPFNTGEAYTMDKTAPRVSSINRSNPPEALTNASSVIYTVTLSEPVAGLTASNFSLRASGVNGASITSIDRATNTTWTVVVGTGTGSGTLGLDMTKAAGITDAAGNVLTGLPFTGEAYTLDRTPPTVLSINRRDPIEAITNAASVTYTVTLSEPVAKLSSSNFKLALSGVKGASITSISQLTDTTWTVTAATGTGDGSLGLNLVSSTGASDAAGNGIAGLPFTGEAYTLDRTPPTVLSINRKVPEAEITNASHVTYTVTFSEPVMGVTHYNFVIISRGVSSAKIESATAGAGSTWTVAVNTGSGDGELSLCMANPTSTADAAGNGVSALPFTGQSYTIDKTPPTLTIGAPSLKVTRSGPVSFTVTYAGADGITLDGSDVTLNKTGTATGSVKVSGTGSSTRTVTVSNITGDGSLGTSLAAGTANDAAGNATNAAGPSAVFIVSNSPPIADISAPSLKLTNGGPVTYTVTYSNAVSITLSAGDITLNTTGSAKGAATVSGAGATTRTVTISGITGDGSLGISLAAGTAINSAGIKADAAGPSAPFTVDNTAPSVTSIKRDTPAGPATNASSVTYAITFDSPVSGLTARSFSLPATGVRGASITSVWASTDTRWMVTVNTGTGDGTLGLDMVSAAGTVDSAGNPVSGLPFRGEAYTISRIGPTVSIGAPSEAATRSGPVSFTVTYKGADSITLNSSDITLNKTGTAKGAVKVSGTGASTRTVTVSNITGEGRLGISLAAGTAKDKAGNSADAAGPSQAFMVDNTAPSVISIKREIPKGPSTNDSRVTYTVIFDSPVTGLAARNFSLPATGVKGASITSVIASTDTAWSVVIGTGTGDGTLGLNMVNSTGASDAAGSPVSGLPFRGEVYTIDKTPPKVVSINRANPSGALTNAGRVTYTLTFSEQVTGISASNFRLPAAGVKEASVYSVLQGNGNTWTALVDTGTRDGTLGLNLVNSTGAFDAAGNALVSLPFTGQTYILDKTPPTVTSIKRKAPAQMMTNAASVTYSVTFSEPVKGVSASNFSIPTRIIAGALITSVKPDGPTSWAVTLNTGSGNGALGLSMVNTTGISDAVSNEVSNELPIEGEVYLIDKADPTVALTSSAPDHTRNPTIPVVVTFNKAVTDFTLKDVIVGNGKAEGFAGSGSVYTLNVTAASIGDVTVDVPANVAHDVAGNGNLAAQRLTRTFLGSSPVISGAVSSQKMSDYTTINPFKTVTIDNPDLNRTLEIAVSLDAPAGGRFTAKSLAASGFKAGSVGMYGLKGTAAQATDALRQLVFAPTPNRLARNKSEALTFVLSANNGVSKPALDRTTTVIVSWVNHAPIAEDARVEASKNQKVGGALKASDPDGDSLFFKIVKQPTKGRVILNDPLKGRFTYTPDQDMAGADTFSFSAKDGKLDSNTATVVISQALTEFKKPVADAGPDQKAKPGDWVALNGSNSFEMNGKIKSFKWTQKSGVDVKIESATSAQTAFIAPEAEPKGLILELEVTDGSGLKDFDWCIVNITESGKPPVADAGPEQKGEEGKMIFLDGSRSLAEGTASYSWRQIKGSPVKLLDSASPRPSFIAPSTGPQCLAFLLRITDKSGLISEDRALVNITSSNIPPKAKAGGNRTVIEGETVVLDAAESSDPEGAISSYRWTQLSGPPVILSDPTAVKPTFTAPCGDSGNVMTFQLTVTDIDGLWSQDKCRVVVKSGRMR